MPAAKTLPAPGSRVLAIPALPAAWSAILVLAAVDALWAPCVGVGVTGWWRPALIALLLLAVAALCRRSRRWSQLSGAADSVATWVAFTAAGCVLTYLGSRATLPLRDDALDAIDRAVGFDWVAWSSWVAAHPALHAAFRLSYMSLAVQIMFSCCMLPLVEGADRAAELFWAALAAILVTVAVSALLPALGAFSRYGFAARADWLTDLLALRGPGPVAFVLPEMKGVITMPSYHAVLAVLFTYAHRRTGVVGLAVAALNLVMLASTPSEGGHYLCDVFAGCAVAAAAIVAVRRLSRTPAAG